MTTPVGTSMTCPACGTPAVPGARFCFNCGSQLDGPDADRVVDAETERRVVTVLFGDLSDFTAWAEDLDPERVGVVTGRLLTALSAAVADVGGHVDKLTGDGIMAVFGAPVAHEDDPGTRGARSRRHAASRSPADRRRVRWWPGARTARRAEHRRGARRVCTRASPTQSSATP